MNTLFESVAAMNPSSSANGASSDLKPKIIPLIDCNTIMPSLATLDFVENLLGLGGFSVVYGNSNVGKSFWALDLAAHIASYQTYRGRLEVDGGAVVYITLEGHASFNNRIAGLKSAGKLIGHPSLYVVKEPIDLLEGFDCEGLIQAIENIRWMEPVRLVVVDTLSRAMPSGDENGTPDMTQVIKSVDRIRKATGAHVMLIHHSGKDAAKGMRGHTCLRAAIDTEIEISRAEGATQILVCVKKQRDLEFIAPMAFSLETVQLGTNKRDKPVTSCFVRHETDATVSFSDSKGFKKTKSVPSPEDVLNLVPEKGSIQKKLLLLQIQEKLNASVRGADSVLLEMVSDGTLLEERVKSKTGQSPVHVTRAKDKWP